jgi:hypothetical protein
MAWTSVKAFFSRQFSAVASCFGRRARAASPAPHDISVPTPPAAPDIPAPTQPVASDIPAPAPPAASDTSALTEPAQANTTPVVEAGSSSAPLVGASSSNQNTQPVEEKPSAHFVAGQQVVWRTFGQPPRSAVFDKTLNQWFVTIEVQEGGQPKIYNVERSTLEPWTETAQREVDQAKATEPAKVGDDWEQIDTALEELHRRKQAPPPIPQVHRMRADAVAAHAQHFPPVTITNLASVEANHRIGGYVELGQTDPTMIKDAFGAWTGRAPDERILQEHTDALKEATASDWQLIDKYVENNGGNKEMREGKVNEFNRNLSAALHRVSLPLPAGMELKRNLRMFADRDVPRKLRQLQPGTIIQSPQFESLALPDGTYGEPGHMMGQANHKVQLRLVTAEGVRGIFIGGKSVIAEEQELLLPENTRYAIHSVSEEPNTGKLIIEAVILPTVQGMLE